MLLLERNQNICISFSGQTRGVVHVIDGTEWKPNIVENIIHLISWDHRSNVLLYFVGQSRCFFDTRSCLGSKVEDKVSAITLREEILSKKGNENKHTDTEKKERGDKDVLLKHEY